MNTDKVQAAKAAEFAERWKGRGYEKGESQLFWADLLTNVYGIDNLPGFIRYEEQVKNMVNSTNFIDARIPSTRVLIEQKSIDKDLRAPIKQSDGYFLTPFQQAKRYVVDMDVDEHPRWIVTCNFKEFLVYDMKQPNGEPESILLEELGTDYYRLKFLIDAKSEHITKEMEVSMQAGEIVGRIYDALLKQYDDNSPEALRWLNILCVRLVFCLYAEDAGIFSRDQFHNYLSKFDTEGMRQALLQLFETLNTPMEKRSKFLRDDLKAFPYTNGGLFGLTIEIPQFTDELRLVLLHNASLDFDWSKISPTIFGAVFESTLNPETRRSGGMHYTSIENIHKVIDPLFLSTLRAEFEKILEEKVEKVRNRLLDAFQEKLASLVFFDPACGSGNFLTETYLSLRRLENEVIRARYHGQTFLGIEEINPIKVSIQQFYGIEINDFAVTVATTALWISEAQMLAETEKIIRLDIDFLPLKDYTNITEGNALRIDWHTVVPVERLSYIIGNPPFVGARLMSECQKADVVEIFGKTWKNVGNLDYVCCWYKKAYGLIKGRHIKAALVSTNSICQGEQVANLWQPLVEDGLRINFAYRTFRWDSEASLKAHVHCIIVGFDENDYRESERILFDNDKIIKANHINAYLLDAPDAFVGSRNKPISDVPDMVFGNMANDGGNLCGYSTEDKDAIIKEYPQAASLFRPFLGAQEFINRKQRWCLWLKGVSPVAIKTVPPVHDAVMRVKELREKSSRAGTRKQAEFPTLFGEIRHPDGDYLLVPRVSSENRRYIPMGFLDSGTIAGDSVQIIPDATLYHFGVLESNVHMAWMRAVCGRLKSDYRYSKDVVYNNFPWPSPTEQQKGKIEKTAQGILDARALFPDSSLADLYDEAAMPPELRKAHQANDRAVMEAYGFPVKSEFTESKCVAELFKIYQEATK